MKSCHFYRIAQCSSKSSVTLPSFSMTFQDLCYFPWLSRPGKWSSKIPWLSVIRGHPGGLLRYARYAGRTGVVRWRREDWRHISTQKKRDEWSSSGPSPPFKLNSNAEYRTVLMNFTKAN